MYKRINIIAIILVVIDQLLKILASNYLVLGNSVVVIPKFLFFTLAHNTGGAFSIFSNSTILLALIGVFALILIYLFLIKNRDFDQLNIILYSMLLAGIIGNLIDRVVHGFVIDYIHMYLFSYSFPIFNFADICIVVSIILIMIREFRGDVSGKSRC